MPGTLGWRVASLREANGWSQNKLAGKAHISQPSLSAIESGDTAPSHIKDITLNSLSAALTVTTEYLRHGEPGAPLKLPDESYVALRKLITIFPGISKRSQERLVGYAESLFMEDNPTKPKRVKS